jgi:hypothetical protein
MTNTNRINAINLVKLQAVLMALLGLVAGILYAFGGALYDLATTGSMNSGTALAFLAIVGMPLIFTMCGVVLGLVGALLYNLLAGRFGGVDLDLLQK